MIKKQYLYLSQITIFGVICIVTIAVWRFVGFFPSNSFANTSDAGQFGDSFGFVTSFFSSFGFIAGMVALIMQIKESHESGERQLKQDRLRLRQLQLARKAATIQETTMKDATRRREEELLVSVLESVYMFNARLMLYRGRASWAASTLADDATEKRRMALNEVLLAKAKLSAIRGAVLIMFMGAASELPDVMTEWTSLMERVRPDEPLPVMGHDEYVESSNRLLQRTVIAVGKIHAQIVKAAKGTPSETP